MLYMRSIKSNYRLKFAGIGFFSSQLDLALIACLIQLLISSKIFIETCNIFYGFTFVNHSPAILMFIYSYFSAFCFAFSSFLFLASSFVSASPSAGFQASSIGGKVSISCSNFWISEDLALLTQTKIIRSIYKPVEIILKVCNLIFTRALIRFLNAVSFNFLSSINSLSSSGFNSFSKPSSSCYFSWIFQ